MNNQPPVQSSSEPQPVVPTPGASGSRRSVWYLVGTLVVIGLALWYFFGMSSSAPSSNPSVGQTNPSANSVAGIQADLNQTDSSASLSSDMASSAAAIQGL